MICEPNVWIGCIVWAVLIVAIVILWDIWKNPPNYGVHA